MTDRRARILKEYGVYALGTFLIQGGTILLIPLYTRYLGVELYGALGLLLGLYAALTIAAQLGLGSAIFRILSDHYHDDGRRAAISTTFWLILFGNCVVIGVFFLLTDLLQAVLNYDGISEFHIKLVLALVLLESINIIPQSVFRSFRQPEAFVYTGIITLVSKALATIFLLAFYGMKLDGVLLGLIFGTIASISFGYIRIRRYLGLYFAAVEARNLLRFGLPSMPGSYASWMMSISGRFVLAFLASPFTVGIFLLSEQIARLIILILIQPFILFWTPFSLSLAKEPQADRKFREAMLYFTVAGSLLALLVSLFAHEIAALAAPADFAEAEKYVFPLAVCALLYGMARIANIGIDIRKKSELYSLAMLLGSVAYIGIAVTLTGAYKIWGLVAGLTLGNLLILFIVFKFSQRYFPIVYDWVQLVKIIALTIVTYLIWYLSHGWLATSMSLTLLLKFVLIGGYLLLLNSTGLFPLKRSRDIVVSMVH